MLSGCTYLSLEDIIVDCDENPISVSVETIAADCSLSNGSAVITATAGKPPYKFQVNDLIQNDNIFSNISSGNYTATVTDANNCSVTSEFVVGNKAGVTASATSTLAGCETTQAALTVIAENGVEPYAYSLNNQTQQSSNVFNNLPAGNHTVVVTDNIGCEFVIEETIFAGTSYFQEVEPIIMNNCAVTGCHSGTQFPDLRVLANVQANKINIRDFTQSGFMPLNGSLTQEQIDAIACWIDDGALDN